MKTIKNLFLALLAASFFIACAAGESETLKKARAVQDGLMDDVHKLDSAVSEYANRLNGDISAAGMDSTLQTDSTKMKNYSLLKDKFNSITTIQSEMMDWKSNLKTLPTIAELSQGAENPFGDNAKDNDILTSLESSKKDFETLKSRVMEVMK
jgi:hypothetical protein